MKSSAWGVGELGVCGSAGSPVCPRTKRAGLSPSRSPPGSAPTQVHTPGSVAGLDFELRSPTKRVLLKPSVTSAIETPLPRRNIPLPTAQSKSANSSCPLTPAYEHFASSKFPPVPETVKVFKPVSSEGQRKPLITVLRKATAAAEVLFMLMELILIDL